MRIVLRHITPDDDRTTTQLKTGEVVSHEIELEVDNRSQRFSVYLQAGALHDIDASVVYGDELLEELLRFEPAGLSRLCRAVAQHRRGESPTLPLTLVEAESETDAPAPRLDRLVLDPQAL